MGYFVWFLIDRRSFGHRWFPLHFDRWILNRTRCWILLPMIFFRRFAGGLLRFLPMLLLSLPFSLHRQGRRWLPLVRWVNDFCPYEDNYASFYAVSNSLTCCSFPNPSEAIPNPSPCRALCYGFIIWLRCGVCLLRASRSQSPRVNQWLGFYDSWVDSPVFNQRKPQVTPKSDHLTIKKIPNSP